MFQFDPYRLDPGRRELWRGDDRIHLEPQVFDLLLFLIENRDRVVSKDELFAAVWQGRIVSDATLNSRINAARRALGDTGGVQAWIRTVPRKGFMFVGDLVQQASQGRVSSEAASAAATPADMGRKQKITFCTSCDGVRLAVASVGSGPVLVKTANWLSHLEYDWGSPIWEPLYQRLCAGRRLVRYDSRGTGLSDRQVPGFSLESFVRDLETVTDALELARFSLFGVSQGVAIALAYAARHPERVEKLVLHGGYAQGRRQRDPASQEQAEALTTLMRYGWAQEHSPFMQAFSSIYVPKGTPEQVRWFIDLQRVSCSAENAIAIRHACDLIDVRADLAKVRAPTLVTHSRFDHVAPFEQGRLIAASVPNAFLSSLESDNHALLPDEPAWARWVEEIERFLGG